MDGKCSRSLVDTQQYVEGRVESGNKKVVRGWGVRGRGGALECEEYINAG